MTTSESKVKRFYPNLVDTFGEMKQSKEGEYVLYADYAAQAERIAQLEQALLICREVLTSPPVLNPEATLRIIDEAMKP